MNVEIESSWKEVLDTEFEKDYFKSLTTKVNEAYRTASVFPPQKLIFEAFNACPFREVSVVILGQDPYHNFNQAHGLAFSVPDDVAIPPSLQNIYKELTNDLKINTPTSGDISHWAKQGVLLLNTTLTVNAHNAGSHHGWGWELFTDTVIKKVSTELENVVFILWGAPAIKKSNLIDSTKHLIIASPHPSPLSAYRGFFGSKPFSKTNEYLRTNNKKPISW